jgi:hypothetical protein
MGYWAFNGLQAAIAYATPADRIEIARVWADTEGDTVVIRAEFMEGLGE